MAVNEMIFDDYDDEILNNIKMLCKQFVDQGCIEEAVKIYQFGLKYERTIWDIVFEKDGVVTNW